MKNQASEFNLETLQEVAQDVIDKLNDGTGLDVYGCDLHNELFNTDYRIIGRYAAERWLIDNIGVFNSIDIIIQYERRNFGEICTDLTKPENVLNMIYYIVGNEVLNIGSINDNWDNRLTQEDINNIINELAIKYNLTNN